MALFTNKTYGQKNKNYIFVFGGLGSSQSQPLFWFLGQVLASHGYHAIIYTSPVLILSPDPKETLKNFEKIKEDALKKIKKLPKKKRDNLAVFGISLGNIPAFMLAQEVAGVKKIIANTPPADFAETVWKWNQKKFNFKKLLAEKKITRKQLKKEWAPLSPINNLNFRNDKSLLLFASLHDEIFPYTQAQEIIKKCEKENINFEAIINSRHKHLISSVINILRFKTYIEFLNTKNTQ